MQTNRTPPLGEAPTAAEQSGVDGSALRRLLVAYAGQAARDFLALSSPELYGPSALPSREESVKLLDAAREHITKSLAAGELPTGTDAWAHEVEQLLRLGASAHTISHGHLDLAPQAHDVFDHVMACLPANTRAEFVAALQEAVTVLVRTAAPAAAPGVIDRTSSAPRHDNRQSRPRFDGAAPAVHSDQLRTMAHRVEKWISQGRTVDVYEAGSDRLAFSLKPFNPHAHAWITQHNAALGWRHDVTAGQLKSGQLVHVQRHQRLSRVERLGRLLDHAMSPEMVQAAVYSYLVGAAARSDALAAPSPQPLDYSGLKLHRRERGSSRPASSGQPPQHRA